MSVTRERSGASVAAYVMADAPLKALHIVAHRMLPHWSMDCSLAALVELPPSHIEVMLPYMLTV